MLIDMNVETCQKRIVYAEQIRGKPGQSFMKGRPCGAPVARSSQWCNEHQYCLDLLNLAAELQYPAFVAVYGRDRDGQRTPYVTIGAGFYAWEAYAVSHAERHHKDLLARLANALRSQRIAVEAEAA